MADDPDMARQADAHGMVVLLTGYLSYRALRGRRDELGLPLRPDEAERLAELEWVFDPEATASPTLPRMHEQHPLRLPVSFRDGDGGIHDGELRDLSAGSFFVETAAAPAVGERITFRFVDEDAAREWHFGGEVERVRGGPGAGIGLRFIGIPLEIRLGTRRGQVYFAA